MYALAGAFQRAIGFALLPLYTRALDPADYGTLFVMVSAASAVAILFSFALDLAIFRTFFEYEDDPVSQRRYIDSVWRFLIVAPLGGACLVSAIAWPFLGSGRIHAVDVLLALNGAALTVAATLIPLSVLRAQQRLRDYIRVTGVTALGTPLLTVIFVVVLDGGITGWLAGVAVGAVLTLGAAMRIVPWHPHSTFDVRMVQRSVGFSLPLLPHALSHWALQLADRIVLAALVSASAVGVYTLAANISTPLMIALLSLNQGFMPTYARAAWNTDSLAAMERVVVLQVSLVVAGCLGGALLGPPLVEIIAPASYSGAAPLIPWIMLGFGFLGLYYIPMNGATLVDGRSRFAWVATALGAVTNIALVVLLVPAYGVLAAAVASALGYFVLLVAIYVYANARSSPIRYRWNRIVPLVAGAATIYGCAAVTTPSDPVLALLVRGLWLAALMIALVGLRIVPLSFRLSGDRDEEPRTHGPSR